MSLMVAIWGPEQDLTDAWLRRVESTVPARTALVHAGVRRTESRVPHVRTRSDDPLSALKALTQREPEKDILLLRTGAEVQADCWQRLQKALLSVADAQSMSALNPFDTGFNPFSCTSDSSTDSRRMDQLVFCYAEHLVAAVEQAATCCSLWRRPDEETSTALHAAADWQDFSRKLAVRGKLAYLCDDIYVHHKSASNARPVQQQPALNRLRSRLRLISTDMLAEGLPQIPLPGLDKKPVQLHVSHSWGGGTQEWINNIAAIQTDRYHLQLRSASESDNLNTAQKFELAMVNQPDMPPLGSWLLTQPITSTADSSREYHMIIEDVMTRYHVEQIVISSLIGHSTEILDQQCPTLVVFHDYFPYWPRLDIAIDELSREQTARRLVDESDQNQREQHHRKLSNRTAEQWIRLRQLLISKLKRPNTVLVAPDQSVINNLVKIDSNLDPAGIHVIPHGATPLTRQKPLGLPADPGLRKLRILIPGRLSDVKGKHLLTPLVESCADIADFWLLGSGKDAEEFFGMSSVSHHHGLRA